VCPLCTPLTNIEDAVIVPPGVAIMGATTGNMVWRSPKAHVHRTLNKLANMFSFGIGVSPYVIVYELKVNRAYLMVYSAFILFQRRAIFTVGLRDSIKPKRVILKWQILYLLNYKVYMGF
jgi:hypothetical protein